MADSVANLDVRIDSLVVVKPIVFGSVSRLLEPSGELNPHTHRWTIYLHPYHDEDMSRYVKKVVFKLHGSFADNSRCLTNPPYEVTETGWGEFEAVIKIFFQCPKEKPVMLKHHLRLFPRPGLHTTEPNEAVVSEFYDEIIFQSPTLRMAQFFLTQAADRSLLPHAKNYEDEKVKAHEKILQAKEKIVNEIMLLKGKISTFETEKRKMEGNLWELVAMETKGSKHIVC